VAYYKTFDIIFKFLAADINKLGVRVWSRTLSFMGSSPGCSV